MTTSVDPAAAHGDTAAHPEPGSVPELVPTAEPAAQAPAVPAAAGPAPAPAAVTPAPTPAPAPTAARPPLRLGLTILQLAALGIVGWGVLSVLFSLLGTGLGLVLVLGVGLVILIGLVYALYGVAWFEVERVSALYRLAVPPLRLRPRVEPGFAGYLRTIGRQSIDGAMWRGIASFVLASVAGTVMLLLFQGLVWAILSAAGASPAFDALSGSLGIGSGDGGSATIGLWGPISAVIVGILCVAGIIGIALLHRSVSVGIVRAGAQTAQLTRQVQVSARQREGAVRAADLERTRIERDLHDGVQPRLVSVGMTLGLAQQKIAEDPEGAKQLIAEAHTSTKAAITELRQLARGIHASVLDDRGLDAALSALASRSHIPVLLDVRLQGRCSREAETAVYFAIAESLTNAAKHSRASECRVVVRLREEGTLWARVEDNGIGGARVLPGGGLDGISNRVLAVGGTVRLDSPQSGPTSLEVSVPCAS
ncbi:histidine kinase [Leucobacter rhizosphaerae]|uniref:histidine kinase n=1 Tax=Leucobacter rhizosphaerae TaxID=2932245 RepID=A0ABY4FSU7_9MICO|nr:histidine kinase [Leucobacter rhizosphaerae]UOQ59373.1 histidine kinase [Leucobacter rhizosphaerae]